MFKIIASFKITPGYIYIYIYIYASLAILFTWGKHFHDLIISLTLGVSAHRTSLTLSLAIKTNTKSQSMTTQKSISLRIYLFECLYRGPSDGFTYRLDRLKPRASKFTYRLDRLKRRASKFRGPPVKEYNIFNTVIGLNVLYFLNNPSVILLIQLYSHFRIYQRFKQPSLSSNSPLLQLIKHTSIFPQS